MLPSHTQYPGNEWVDFVGQIRSLKQEEMLLSAQTLFLAQTGRSYARRRLSCQFLQSTTELRVGTRVL